MDLQSGQWVECERTQIRGEIKFRKDKIICVSLGKDITLYTSLQTLESLGWKPIAFNH